MMGTTDLPTQNWKYHPEAFKTKFMVRIQKIIIPIKEFSREAIQDKTSCRKD